MGAWGTGISSNDTYADIYEQFIELYNEGHSVAEITAKLIRENHETIGIDEDAANFWFALANGQWECKALDPDILNRVEQIIVSGEDLSAWRKLGATRSDLRARGKALNRFLFKLRTERNKPRKKRKKKYYDSIYKKGDCLVYRMDNGNYGGAFVLTEEKATEVGTNYVAITTIDKSDKPTLQDFKHAEVEMRWRGEISFKGNELHKEWVDEPQIGGVYAASIKQKTFGIEVVGNLPMYKEYLIERIIGFGWRALEVIVPSRKEYERINGKSKSRLKLSEWTKKRWGFPFL